MFRILRILSHFLESKTVQPSLGWGSVHPNVQVLAGAMWLQPLFSELPTPAVPGALPTALREVGVHPSRGLASPKVLMGEHLQRGAPPPTPWGDLSGFWIGFWLGSELLGVAHSSPCPGTVPGSLCPVFAVNGSFPETSCTRLMASLSCIFCFCSAHHPLLFHRARSLQWGWWEFFLWAHPWLCNPQVESPRLKCLRRLLARRVPFREKWTWRFLATVLIISK